MFSTYDQWKLRSPDDEYFDLYGEEPEFEPEIYPVEFDDLEFLMPAE